MDALTCSICLEQFDLVERRPKALPCGHSLCQECLAATHAAGRNFCPEDRRPFPKNPHEINDNYVVLRLLEETATANSSTKFHCIECNDQATPHCVEEHHVCNLKSFWRGKVQNIKAELSTLIDQECGVIQTAIDRLQSVADGIRKEIDEHKAEQTRLKRMVDSMVQSAGIRPKEACEAMQQAMTSSRDRLTSFRRRADMLGPAAGGRITGRCEVALTTESGRLAWERALDPQQERALSFALYWLQASQDVMEQESLVARLPDKTLALIFQCLSSADLVTASQVCWRWRRVALDPSAWRFRELRDTSGEGRDLVRVLRVAPCLGFLRAFNTCMGSRSRTYRKAEMLKAPCKIVDLGLMCSKGEYECPVDSHWAIAMLHKHRTSVEELYLSYASAQTLEIAGSMPHLRTLVVTSSGSDIQGSAHRLSPAATFRSLESLDASLPIVTSCSLLAACRFTIQKIAIKADVPGDGQNDHLKLLFAEGGFSSLKVLKLKRLHDSVDDEIRCRQQLKRLGKLNALQGVSVRCSVCDML